MKYCKTCNLELSPDRKLGELVDYCSISCSNKDPIINSKRVNASRKTREERKFIVPARTLFYTLKQLKNEIGIRSSRQGLIINSFKNLSLKPEILFYTEFLKTDNWQERIYCIKNNISVAPLCEECKVNKVSFSGQKDIGYFRFCCKSCSAQSEQTKIERATTNLLKYGDEIAFRNPEIKLKQRETIKRRYNVTNSWHLSKHSGISKISQELFWNVWQNSKQYGEIYFGELSGELRLNFNGKIYKPDYAQIDGDDKRIIEFDGEYWHSDSSKAQDIEREKILKNDGWKIFRVREKEYMQDKLEITNYCLAFLNKDIE